MDYLLDISINKARRSLGSSLELCPQSSYEIRPSHSDHIILSWLGAGPVGKTGCMTDPYKIHAASHPQEFNVVSKSAADQSDQKVEGHAVFSSAGD
jgi:hypothetical protein